LQPLGLGAGHVAGGGLFGFRRLSGLRLPDIDRATGIGPNGHFLAAVIAVSGARFQKADVMSHVVFRLAMRALEVVGHALK
jgi:hypothetical protein